MSDGPVQSTSHDSDASLLQRLASGDAKALETLYDRHGGYVYALAVRVLGRGADAEEVTQDVFWQLWKNKLHYDPARGRFSTWLFAVTRNRCIDRLRREKRRPLIEPLAFDRQSPADSTQEQAVFHEERRGVLLEALAALPAPQRQALELCFFSGLTHQEAASHLGAPLGTIKSRIKLGLAKVRERLRASESSIG